jgi:hypothetical protein
MISLRDDALSWQLQDNRHKQSDEDRMCGGACGCFEGDAGRHIALDEIAFVRARDAVDRVGVTQWN